MAIFVNEWTMTETLFGGIVAAAVLFFSVRKLGLSNFWAGILSGILPFIAYLFYCSKHWAGGDVLTIHFAVYLANAGLLIVFGGMQRKKERMHWAPRLIIAFFVGLVVLNAIFLSISTRGLPDALARVFLPNPAEKEVHTGFPGVIPHDRNKLYEPHVEQLEQQKNLGWTVQVDGLDMLKKKLSSTVSVKLLDKQKQPVTGATVTIELWRMANSADDTTVPFTETAAGVYQAKLRLVDEGLWITDLQIAHGQDHYSNKQSISVASE
jgi:hypothetical protein